MISKQAALLIVDVQNGFVTNDATKRTVPVINRVKHAFGERKIMASKFINPDGGLWEELMGWHDMKQPPGTDFYPELDTKNTKVFMKQTYSAWSDEMRNYCEKFAIKEVYLVGIDTDQCVLATAIDLFSACVKPFVVADACASSTSKELHIAALKVLQGLIGKEQIISSSDLLY